MLAIGGEKKKKKITAEPASGLWSSGFLMGPNSISSEVNRNQTELKTNPERKCLLSKGKFYVKPGKAVACQRRLESILEGCEILEEVNAFNRAKY